MPENKNNVLCEFNYGIFPFSKLQIGQALVDEGHYASKDISDTLNKLNYQWADLYERARDKVVSSFQFNQK